MVPGVGGQLGRPAASSRKVGSTAARRAHRTWLHLSLVSNCQSFKRENRMSRFLHFICKAQALRKVATGRRCVIEFSHLTVLGYKTPISVHMHGFRESSFPKIRNT